MCADIKQCKGLLKKVLKSLFQFLKQHVIHFYRHLSLDEMFIWSLCVWNTGPALSDPNSSPPCVLDSWMVESFVSFPGWSHSSSSCSKPQKTRFTSLETDRGSVHPACLEHLRTNESASRAECFFEQMQNDLSCQQVTTQASDSGMSPIQTSATLLKDYLEDWRLNFGRSCPWRKTGLEEHRSGFVIMASEVVCGLMFRLLLPVCLAAGKTSCFNINNIHFCSFILIDPAENNWFDCIT